MKIFESQEKWLLHWDFTFYTTLQKKIFFPKAVQKSQSYSANHFLSEIQKKIFFQKQCKSHNLRVLITFLWDTKIFMGTPWSPHGAPIEPPWSHHGTLHSHHGATMEPLWSPHGATMEPLWSPMEPPWSHHGAIMEPPWNPP